MNTYYAAPWSSSPSPDDKRYRTTHQERTKQRGNGQQQRPELHDSWTWEEILDDKVPWAQAGEYRRPKAELEAVKAESWLEAREAAPKMYWGRGHTMRWRSQVGNLRQLPVLTGEREGPGRHRVMP